LAVVVGMKPNDHPEPTKSNAKKTTKNPTHYIKPRSPENFKLMTTTGQD